MPRDDGASASGESPAVGGAAQETPKYAFESLIAEGAEGRVYVVRDGDLDRRVAMKVMRPGTSDDMRRMQRFLTEARRTASLEHAGIPGVHDLGYVATGEMFFTMRLVEGRTLREVFEKLVSCDPDFQREWTLTRIVQVLQQVAAAVDYAHCQGIIHRDLKPENIAVSEFHEVLVLDWGLSKRIGRDPEAVHAPVEGDRFATQIGAVKGTPLYMAPEQARGAVDKLDVRADVFSLGAILYEALCHEPPYDGHSVKDILDNAKAGRIVPIDTRARGRDLPRALVDTCMRALSPEADGRHANAKMFSDDLQAFLEGTKERELRLREASGLIESARRLVARANQLHDEAERLDRMATDLRRTLPPWAGEDDKRRLWQLEDGAKRTRVDGADTHARATDLASRALAHDAQHPEARSLVARLHFDRYLDAERRGHVEEATWLRRMVERYDDGALGDRFRDRAAIAVETEPAGARVVVSKLAEQDRRRVAVSPRELERTPLVDDSLGAGDWLLEIRHDGCEHARVPIRLGRGERRVVSVRLLRSGALPRGFVLVPRGEFIYGQGTDATPVDTGDFAIAETPVQLRDYAAWLDELAATGLEAASPHVPWVETHGALLRLSGGKHVFNPASPMSRRPLVEHPELPVVGIARASAEAYAAWLGARTGVTLTLPTEVQWEKAARGTDGRAYPWGDHFDPTFCSMYESTRDPANLRPIGAFPSDVSPYGVRDMAGGVREWCRDDVDAGRKLAVCRGGAWYLRGRECTVTSRWTVEADTRNPGIGFRLCWEIPST
ncbi:MAG: SUMF1/EgtB/PvdO family nonheme iron enzyme [Planctomycetes bacterium]|nr:SUMF1/EgtB/PvdO family nonheme iron enzyme [Planctomycetota bacterium]